jgi:putative aldouronate transport system permease protein
MTILFGFWVPIAFALLLNEIRLKAFKKVAQTISYLPHFISTVVIAGILLGIMDYDDGAINLLQDLPTFGRPTTAT